MDFILEKLIKEKYLIVNGVIPVHTIMPSGAGDEVVIDLPVEQALVQVLIYVEEEIGFTAIDNQSLFAINEAADQIDDRLLVPPFGVIGQCPQLLGHVPTLRKRTDIDTATRASGCTEHLFVA